VIQQDLFLAQPKRMLNVFDSPLFKEIKPHIVKKFIKFHLANPHVYEHVERFAFEALKSGRSAFGIGMIWERMRWYLNIETKGNEFKLCNDHRSCYARLLMLDHPEFQSFFRRKVSNQ